MFDVHRQSGLTALSDGQSLYLADSVEAYTDQKSQLKGIPFPLLSSGGGGVLQVLSLLFSSWQVHPGYWWSTPTLARRCTTL
jgi:hypothetical protein